MKRRLFRIRKLNLIKIIINGKRFQSLHAIDSISEGIQVIYQDLSLFPNLTIAENISLNQTIERKKRFINWKEIRNIAERELSNINKKLDLDERVENISIANKQLVAICRALTQDAKLIIMDEPTTAITKSEIDCLFSVILDLKKTDMEKDEKLLKDLREYMMMLLNCLLQTSNLGPETLSLSHNRIAWQP